MIRFENPWWSLGFLAVALTGLLMILAWSQRQKNYSRLIQKELQPFVTAHGQSKNDALDALFFLAALSFMVLSLMRPQWGSRWEQIKKQGYDILFAMDVSKSMLAADLKPNRLARTKLALDDFAKRSQGNRLGLIAFAGEAFLACPLTTDTLIFQTILGDLSPESISAPGTSISSAIDEAVKAYQEGANSVHKILFLVSDGEDHEGRVLESAREAAKAGIRIYSLGIGSPEGELISEASGSGSPQYLKDNQGRVVKSRLNEPLLKKIAETTGGLYQRSTPVEFGLEPLYEKAVARFKTQEFSEAGIQRFTERYQIFSGLALFLLFPQIWAGKRGM
ncbi:MAG: VWA domain-containing protein [Candidatus Omnitrophota bacterium]